MGSRVCFKVFQIGSLKKAFKKATNKFFDWIPFESPFHRPKFGECDRLRIWGPDLEPKVSIQSGSEGQRKARSPGKDLHREAFSKLPRMPFGFSELPGMSVSSQLTTAAKHCLRFCQDSQEDGIASKTCTTMISARDVASSNSEQEAHRRGRSSLHWGDAWSSADPQQLRWPKSWLEIHGRVTAMKDLALFLTPNLFLSACFFSRASSSAFHACLIPSFPTQGFSKIFLRVLIPKGMLSFASHAVPISSCQTLCFSWASPTFRWLLASLFRLLSSARKNISPGLPEPGENLNSLECPREQIKQLDRPGKLKSCNDGPVSS